MPVCRMGFAALYPSYARPRFRSPHERSDMRGLLRMVPDVASLIRATAPMFSPDPVEAVPDRREDAADVLAQGVERVEIIEDAGEAVFHLALALGQRLDA